MPLHAFPFIATPLALELFFIMLNPFSYLPSAAPSSPNAAASPNLTEQWATDAA